MARKRSVEIYLKPGIEEDDQIFAVWAALRHRGRPQDVFRRMLRAGLRAMVEAGELPRVALSHVDPDLLVPTPPATGLLRARGGRAQTARVNRSERAPLVVPQSPDRAESEAASRIPKDSDAVYPSVAEPVVEHAAPSVEEAPGVAPPPEPMAMRPRVGRLM